MKLIGYCILCAILFIGSTSCTKKAKPNPKANSGITIGQIDTLNSNILGENRELIIYLPESAKDPKLKREQYPVVYLLDGRYPFIPFVSMLRTYSEMYDNKILPEMIVVGISNTNRTFDFSPTTADNPEQFGGGEKFLEFIEKELFAYVEQTYSGSQKNRTIIGHSFGGLVVMNSLTRHPELFQNYLLIDGSLWFDNELFLTNQEYSIQNKDLSTKNLYIAAANTATYDSTLETIKNDSISANGYVRHHLELVKQIQNMKKGNPNMDWKYYQNDTHGSTAYLAYLDAFRFFYSWFEFKKETKYMTKYFVPETKEDRFATLTKSHFEKVSEKLGYTFLPQEEWIRGSAEMLLNFHKQKGQALETFLLNKEYYPNSPFTHKDLADFYLSIQDTVKAIQHYKRVLELENIPDVRQTLNAIDH